MPSEMRASLRDNAGLAVDGRFADEGAPTTATVGGFSEPPPMGFTEPPVGIVADGAIGVVLGRNDDKRLHAEGANRARTATRPAMGPLADIGFEPAPGRITAGFGETCAPNQAQMPRASFNSPGFSLCVHHLTSPAGFAARRCQVQGQGDLHRGPQARSPQPR